MLRLISPSLLWIFGAWILFLTTGVLPFSALADTTIEIVPHPIVIDARVLSQTPPDQRDARAAAAANDWVHDYGSQLPVVRTTQAGQSDVVAGLGDAGEKALGKLVFDVMHFANDVSSQSRSFESDFKVQFMHAISARAPGYAWVVEAERTGFDLGFMNGFREGGAAGVQIPLLGSKDLWVKNGEGQVVLRILPVGGNYETVQAGPDELNLVAAPGSGIVLRPTVEAEATYQFHGVQPGLRFLVQPKLLQPTEARMIAEVYVNIDIDTDNKLFSKISIVPRCLIDFSNDATAFTGPYAAQYTEGYRLLNKSETCSLSASFTFGM